MAQSGEQQTRRTNRLTDIHEVLEQNFPDVERVGISRFLVWGSHEFKYRPYVEIWFDQDFLDQDNDDFQAYRERIVLETDAVLGNPDQRVRKQGEILASGLSGIKVRRGFRIYDLADIHENLSDGSRPE